MGVSRIDLCDAGSPEKLVTLILKHEPQLSVPVPLEQLCKQLDILEIQHLDTEGFEGGLITDVDRHSGIILHKRGNRKRVRFTIGHELAHFLSAHHVPDKPGRFLCTRKDLALLSAKEKDRRALMEVEANRFSALILVPPPLLRRHIASNKDPSIEEMITLADLFVVSKQVMGRAYTSHHPTPTALILVEGNIIRQCQKDAIKFPFIKPRIREPVPPGSLFYKMERAPGSISKVEACLPDVWIDVPWGKKAPEVYEQILGQQDGWSTIMLHMVVPDEDEEEEERLVERNWRVGFGR